MKKKDYMKPVIEFDELDISEELLAYSVQSTGLDGDGEELSQDVDNPTGNAWNDAMSRHNVWDEGEEW